MFEDLISKKNPYSFNIRTQYPHCKSTLITLFFVQGIMNGKRKQEVYCRMCAKRWYLIHTKDMQYAFIQYI